MKSRKISVVTAGHVCPFVNGKNVKKISVKRNLVRAIYVISFVPEPPQVL